MALLQTGLQLLDAFSNKFDYHIDLYESVLLKKWFIMSLFEIIESFPYVKYR